MKDRLETTRAEKRDWMRTVRQSIPNALSIARSLRPTFDLGSLDEIDGGFLERHAIRGVVWDVDGTLTHYHAASVATEVAGPVARLFAHTSLRHAIVSNCDEVRFRELGVIFPEVPVLKVYRTIDGLLGRRLFRGVETWFPELGGATDATVDPGTAALVPIRKPNADVIRFAVDQLGLEPGAALMVGDQYWTDVAGANLGGIRSARVPVVGRSTFPAPIRLFQQLDRWMRRILA